MTSQLPSEITTLSLRKSLGNTEMSCSQRESSPQCLKEAELEKEEVDTAAEVSLT